MIDIDNTIFPLLGGLRAIEPGIRDLDLSHDEKSLREELKDFGFDLDLLLEDLYHNQEIMNSVGIFPGAEKIISVLKEHGIKLHIVSK